ncbi:major facilitator superfamily domain-containing protein 6 [Nephila pilipes]|uniref:Major facilitator superfamily domain-containing protein 6 n=1 Tax=Nephila pilipes TaxID=299642 RepID=A0A8X6MJH9_NEPPI|nr:major facilitator superfamily domain-containing protein 6 [Nephila pilipes]
MSASKIETIIDVCVIFDEPSNKQVMSKPFWHIDWDMFRFKIHYFLLIGALAQVTPFIAVFAKEKLGLSASSLGTVLTAQMFLFIFTRPLIGYIADYLNKLKAIICILTVINVACFYLLLAIPKYEGNEMANSTLPFVQSQFQTKNICHNLFASSRNRKIFTLTESSSVNFTHNQTERGNICTLCSLDNETCVKDCKVIAFDENYFTFFRTKNSSFDYEKTIVATSQQLALLCDQNDFINISLCLYDAISTGYQNRSRSENELVCSNILVSNETRKTYDAFICSILPTSYKNDIFISCSEKNISRNDLLSLNISKQKTVSDFVTYQFWAFGLIFTISSICASSNFTLSDTACCESIQKTGAEFGKQRLWGAIGWGINAALAGFINDSTGDFLASWTVAAVMLLLFLWNISKLDLVKPNFSKNILGDVGSVFKSKEFLAYELVVLINGMGTGIIWFYLIWFLTAIGGSEFLCGLSVTVQSLLGVIPFMFFSGWIIEKMGHFRILSASLLIYTIRFLWYSYLHNPWLVLPMEVTHGITYGLCYAVLASYAKTSSKPGTEATTQSVVFSTFEGLGTGLGCVLAGISFDYVGGQQTFFFASIFGACSFILSILMYFLIVRR